MCPVVVFFVGAGSKLVSAAQPAAGGLLEEASAPQANGDLPEMIRQEGAEAPSPSARGPGRC